MESHKEVYLLCRIEQNKVSIRTIIGYGEAEVELTLEASASMALKGVKHDVDPKTFLVTSQE